MAEARVCSFHKSVCSKETFKYCDHILYQQLVRWAIRRHPNKSKKWVRHKYWHTKGKDNYLFSVKTEGLIVFELAYHAKTEIVRHTKVKSGRSLFDGELIYWSTRLGKHPEMPKTKATLLKRQKGKCKYCELHFKEGDKLELDHITPKSKGGKNEYKNFQLLHKHCHDKKTATDGSLENILVKEIPPTQLQQIAEYLFNEKITEGNGKLSTWEFQVLREAGLLTCIHNKEFIRERYEVSLLNYGDFEPEAKELKILGKGKGTQTEIIGLSTSTTNALLDWCKAYKHRKKKAPLFVALDFKHKGHRITGDGIYKLVRRYCKQAGISKRMSPHRVRHSSITAALDVSNDNVPKVQKLSRHRQIDTLMIYDDNRAKVQVELSEMLSGLTD